VVTSAEEAGNIRAGFRDAVGVFASAGLAGVVGMGALTATTVTWDAWTMTFLVATGLLTVASFAASLSVALTYRFMRLER
jgi:hypothetical protein